VPTVDLDCKIPNNVGLADDPKLRRALEHWQPRYVDWWRAHGPAGLDGAEVYLRTAVSVERGGWAQWGYVRPEDYRWGVFVSPQVEHTLISVGDETGQAAWDRVPGEHRNALRRIIVTQADTEPASVEQQRHVGALAPSMYDLRNLLQVNVEEGRHLWAMVYLLQKYFGRDGRDEADELLERRAGDADKPRILGTFNRPCDHFLSFFCFTTFTDRDGKFQLAALAESAFDPLARSCQFMLTEEAFHLMVGETGMERVILRSAELAKLDPNGDATAQGGVGLDMIQRAVNYWFSSCLDLFGGEESSNAASYFASGLKGRFRERARYTDHLAAEQTYPLTVMEDGRMTTRDVPMRRAMNEVLRDDYIEDCGKVVDRWNRKLAAIDSPFRIELPNRRFHRHQGIYAGDHFDPAGNPVSAETFEAHRDQWLLSDADNAYIQSISTPVREPGKFAHWIQPPNKGIGHQPVDFEYVRA
jgi:benzoyl-CoA 2,3-dioxygenase component B